MVQAVKRLVQRQEMPMPAMLGPFPVESGTVFPAGAYAVGAFEKVRDFDRSKGDVVVQQVDKTVIILSFRVRQGCDLQRPVVDSVVDGTLAA
jgi:hypothetical protein